MTDQEFFDASVAHLRRQGVASMDERGMCVYRDDQGRGCAVGGVMPPNLIEVVLRRGYNGASFSGLVGDLREAREFFDGVSVPLATSMQCIHDGVEPAQWEQEFRRKAESYGLVYTPPGAQA